MKNTSIFIPLLLTGCLAALLYLFFAALSASEEEDARTSDRIVLNEEDYRTPATTPANDLTALDSRYGNTTPGVAGQNAAENDDVENDDVENDDVDFGDYFEEVPDEEKVVRAASSTATPPPSRNTAAAPRPSGATTRPVPHKGRYLVIAGTFVQAANARERVNALRAAGFTDTRAENFNRGAYSVALAGQYESYSSARTLAEKIARRGFEVRVMKRR